MKRDIRKQLKFSFGRPETFGERLAFLAAHSKLYYNLVRPLKFLLLKTGTLHLTFGSRVMKFLLLPLAARIKEKNLYRVRAACLEPERQPDNMHMRDLIEKGHADLSDTIKISVDEAREAADYFYNSQAYDSQVPLNSSFQTRPVREILSRNGALGDYFSFTPDVSLNCPMIARLLREPFFATMAQRYIGGMPQVYSVNTMLTVPSAAKRQVTTMHRDLDDYKQLTFFIYWTPTAADNGATYFVPKSHVDPRARESGIYLEGQAGSVFALDTFGLHSGNSNVTSPRLTTWIRFGHLPNFAYYADKNYLFAPEFRALKLLP